MMRPLTLLSAILLLFTLSACDSSTEQAGQAQAEAPSNADASLQQKLNANTGAFNVLIAPGSGLAAYAGGYDQRNIPEAIASQTISLQALPVSFENALGTLREAREIDGGELTAALDASIDRLIPALDTALSQWRQIEPYYNSRAYRNDDLAKGKAAHEPLVAALADGVAALSDMQEALSVIQRQRTEARIAALTDAGHTAEASVLSAMHTADAFVTAVSMGNIEEATRLAPDFERALEEMRSNEEQYTGPEHGKVLYGVLAGTLTRVIGSWRDYEASKDEFNLNTLIDTYNSAIRTAGSMPMPA